MDTRIRVPTPYRSCRVWLGRMILGFYTRLHIYKIKTRRNNAKTTILITTSAPRTNSTLQTMQSLFPRCPLAAWLCIQLFPNARTPQIMLPKNPTQSCTQNMFQAINSDRTRRRDDARAGRTDCCCTRTGPHTA